MKDGVYVGLYVLGILFFCAYICIYVGVWQYSFVCVHVWVLCVVPQLSAKAPGMIPYSYFPFCQFSIIL